MRSPGPSGGSTLLPGTGASVRDLRVLDITDCYSDSVSGGVKTYLHEKSEALARRGIRHAMIVPGEETVEASLGETRLFRIRGPIVPMSRAYRTILSARAVRAALLDFRPHVVEVGSPFLVPRLLRRALDGRRLPTVGFYHSDIVRTFAEPYVQSRAMAPVRVLARMAARRLVRSVYRRFDVTVGASDSIVRELRAFGIPDVRAVGLGVDLDTFRPLPAGERIDRSRWGVEPGVAVGVYAGRFCAEKRLDVLLEGHALIPPERRPHIVLVGGGPLRDDVRKLAAGRRRLTLLPYVQDRSELARVYASADFYLGTGPGETFGLSIAEGMACGLPVVAVGRGAAPDRVAGSGVGEIYSHGRPSSAAVALGNMVERVARRGPWLRSRARAHAERHFDWAGTFDGLVSLYRELAPVRPR